MKHEDVCFFISDYLVQNKDVWKVVWNIENHRQIMTIDTTKCEVQIIKAMNVVR